MRQHEGGYAVSEYEVRRNDDGSLDEFVAEDVAVHLEQMDGNEWFLDIEQGDQTVRIFLTAKGRIRATLEAKPSATREKEGA
jgi:hypothetical protein